MALYKSAQINTPNNPYNDKDQVIIYEDQDVVPIEDVVEVHAPSIKPHFVIEEEFNVPELPGSELPLEVVENEHAAEEAKMKEDENKAEEGKPKDLLDLATHRGDVNAWGRAVIDAVPKHKGERAGLLRALRFIENEIRKAYKTIEHDYKGELDIGRFDQVMNMLEDSTARLQQAHDRAQKIKDQSRKKADDEQDGFLKEARTPFPNAMVVSVPILLSTIARSIINGVVSQGRDVKDLYNQHVKKFSLDLRDRASLLQHLDDCGYPMGIRDRLVMDDEELEVNSPKELASSYFA